MKNRLFLLLLYGFIKIIKLAFSLLNLIHYYTKYSYSTHSLILSESVNLLFFTYLFIYFLMKYHNITILYYMNYIFFIKERIIFPL